MAARPLRPVSIGAVCEGFLGVVVLFISAVGGASAASWVFDEELNVARIAVWAAFVVAGLGFAYGLYLDVFGQDDFAVPILWISFPILAVTSVVFVGFFASWSVYFLPIVPMAVVTLLLSYFTGGSRQA
jgi:hypothetical protein